MKPEIGDKVLVKDYSGSYEGIVFRLPHEASDVYYVGLESGVTKYADPDKITILFRPTYTYANRCPYKVGDLVNWQGLKALVVSYSESGDWNYRIAPLDGSGVVEAREQDLVLVSAAKHPEEVKVAPAPEPDILPEGWYGWSADEEAPEQTLYDVEEVDDEPLPFRSEETRNEVDYEPIPF